MIYFQNQKKGKHTFEIKMSSRRPYLLSADNESESKDWIITINKIINLAETASQISLEPTKGTTINKIINLAETASQISLEPTKGTTIISLTKTV